VAPQHSPLTRPPSHANAPPCCPLSIACTLQLLLFFFIAIFALPPKHYMPTDPTALEFFKMPVLFLMLITVLNDGTLITVAYDNVKPSKVPEKWNLKALW
jgi:H+-transporting ATPase